MWVCQMFATSWGPFSLDKHMPQHMLWESWITTPKLLNEHLCLHPKQIALSVGLRKVLHKALVLAEVSISSQVWRSAKVYQQKIWPTALQADRSVSMIWTTQGWMIDGKKHFSPGNGKPIQRTSFTRKWHSSYLLGSLLLSYCLHGKVLPWENSEYFIFPQGRKHPFQTWMHKEKPKERKKPRNTERLLQVLPAYRTS